jgi:hypothetical protein
MLNSVPMYVGCIVICSITLDQEQKVDRDQEVKNQKAKVPKENVRRVYQKNRVILNIGYDRKVKKICLHDRTVIYNIIQQQRNLHFLVEVDLVNEL